MKRPAIIRSAVIIAAAALSGGIVFGPPAHADPPSGSETMVEIPLPGPAGTAASSQAADSYQPPVVTLSEQGGDAGGVDRDGTDGQIDPDGTNGTITGPLMRAIPLIRAEPAPKSAKGMS